MIRWLNLLACGGPAMVCLCAAYLSSGHLAGRKKNPVAWLTRVGLQ